MTLEPGASATLEHVVRREDLATSWKNDVEVLSTPILLWLAELACMAALGERVKPPWMTLGTAHQVKHLAPTPEGFRLSITARLAEVENRKLVFDVEASDGAEPILSGRHERFLVDGGRFRARVAEKKARGSPR